MKTKNKLSTVNDKKIKTEKKTNFKIQIYNCSASLKSSFIL